MKYHYYRFSNIDSTQNFVAAQDNFPLPVICRADSQSAGYGQRGAAWFSPKGGLYFSVGLEINQRQELLAGITQYIAITVAKLLNNGVKNNTEEVKIKWPNDLFYRGKKCAGILLQSSKADNAEKSKIILGIGVNFFAEDGNFIGLRDAFFSANDLFERLIPELFSLFNYWEKTPYLPLDNLWDKFDLFRNQEIKLEGDGKIYRNLGIDQKGRICLKNGARVEFLTSVRISKECFN
ncbi:MAG: biotin--[Cardiobacteriaceae bacterium]|nr:biotin--[acetyl-CoA-carboxylase] ligase [Cardiobacteriaceae bacterium]